MIDIVERLKLSSSAEAREAAAEIERLREIERRYKEAMTSIKDRLIAVTAKRDARLKIMQADLAECATQEGETG